MSPIILGTMPSKYGRARAAKHADGWIPVGALHDNIEADIEDMHAALRANGREPKDFPISMFDILETSEEDIRRYADIGCIERAIPRCPTEDKDTVLRWLDRYAKIGASIGAM